jgi:hypothetical protein
MNNVWLVTGSASGLGRNIAEAVLESGDRLVATARDTKRLDDLVKKYGDRVRAVPLDVTDESAAQAAVQSAVAAFACENCETQMLPNSVEAMICSFEYTFCRTCVEGILDNVCPICGGGFSARPIRPARR